jgi:UDP-glucose 4-epimerase
MAAGVGEATAGEVFNIGTNVETSILELAKLVVELSDSRSQIRFVTQESVYGPSYEDIPRRVPDIAKMESILGVHAGVSLRDGLRRTIDWFRSAKG